MKKINNTLFFSLLALLFSFGFIQNSYADICYKNDLKIELSNNKAVIYALVIRTFNAKDLDGNGIVEKGEESGNFINAIDRLDEIKSLGINTIHLLPVTPVGEINALGTAGSVYALNGFDSINPELHMPGDKLTVFEEAKKFVKECHKRNIKVMMDLPACGSVDLFNAHPELFVIDKDGKPIVPLDWSDVRLYKVWKDNTRKELNPALLDAHKKFIDMCINLKIDGIRADVPSLKSPEFWKEFINYAHKKDPQFGFLAESYDSWRTPVSKYGPNSQPEQLLKVGFDAYYGSYCKIGEWKTANDINKQVLFNIKLTNSYKTKKSVIGSFATHDTESPVYTGGVGFSKLITILETTLPALDPYFIAGFESGDTYIYPYANQTASTTQTDSNKYYVHNAKLDIFNYSRKPGGQYKEIGDLMKKSLEFRKQNEDLIIKGKYIPLNTDSVDKQVFAFIRSYKKQHILVIANKDLKNVQKCKIYLQKINNKNQLSIIINTDKNFKYSKSGKSLSVELKPLQALILEIK